MCFSLIYHLHPSMIIITCLCLLNPYIYPQWGRSLTKPSSTSWMGTTIVKIVLSCLPFWACSSASPWSARWGCWAHTDDTPACHTRSASPQIWAWCFSLFWRSVGICFHRWSPSWNQRLHCLHPCTDSFSGSYVPRWHAFLAGCHDCLCWLKNRNWPHHCMVLFSRTLLSSVGNLQQMH